jgi:hypothetical protein
VDSAAKHPDSAFAEGVFRAEQVGVNRAYRGYGDGVRFPVLGWFHPPARSLELSNTREHTFSRTAPDVYKLTLSSEPHDSCGPAGW